MPSHTEQIQKDVDALRPDTRMELALFIALYQAFEQKLPAGQIKDIYRAGMHVYKDVWAHVMLTHILELAEKHDTSVKHVVEDTLGALGDRGSKRFDQFWKIGRAHV